MTNVINHDDSLNALLVIFLFVADDQVGLEPVNQVKAKLIRAGHAGYLGRFVGRTHAKFGAAGRLRLQPQVKQQLRLRGNQGDDALRLWRNGDAAPHLVGHGVSGAQVHSYFSA